MWLPVIETWRHGWGTGTFFRRFGVRLHWSLRKHCATLNGCSMLKKNSNEHLKSCLFNSANRVAVAFTVWQGETVKNEGFVLPLYEVSKLGVSCVWLSIKPIIFACNSWMASQLELRMMCKKEPLEIVTVTALRRWLLCHGIQAPTSMKKSKSIERSVRLRVGI